MMERIKRRLFYPRRLRIFFYHLMVIKLRHCFLKILKDKKYKNILYMDAIPFLSCMMQRPHHISKFLSEKFDIVLYRAGMISKPQWFSDKILLCPVVDIVKCKHKNIYYYIDSINETSTYKQLKKIKKLGWKIIYDYIDEVSPDICKLKVPLKIYKNLEKIDPDLIITASDKLYDDMVKRFSKEKIVLAKNGVVVEDFLKTPQSAPDDLKPILEQNKPIVGYYGCMAKWIDFDLLNQASRMRPEYNFVYFGKDSQNSLKNLELNKNVYFLGRKQYDEVVKYAFYFDIVTIPFKHGKIAKATSPVKLYEYMALKKPVVCTRDLDECRNFSGVLMSDNNEEFIENLDKAIIMSKDENVKNALLEQAKKHTWQARASLILEKLGINE